MNLIMGGEARGTKKSAEGGERKRDKDKEKRAERDLSILSIGKRRVSGSSIIRVPVSNY